jgi:hypothetical protein
MRKQEKRRTSEYRRLHDEATLISFRFACNYKLFQQFFIKKIP